MLSETICKVLGFIALVIIGSYLFRIIMNYNTNKNGFIIEGFDSGDGDMSDDEFKQVKELVEKIKKSSIKAQNQIKLNTPEMRQQYEDILKYMDTYVGSKILMNIFLFSWVTTNDKRDDDGAFEDDWTMKLVKKTILMSEFQQTINRTLTEWLDNQGNNSESSKVKSSAW